MNFIKKNLESVFTVIVPTLALAPDNVRVQEVAVATGTERHQYLPAPIPGYRLDKTLFQTLMFLWDREQNRSDTAVRRGLWIGGPRRAGKTTGVEQFFAALGMPVLSITCNRRIPLSDYIRQMLPDGTGGWMSLPGPLVTAMEQGYPVVLNEASSMDPADLLAMNDIIDRGLLVMDDGTVVKAVRGFLVFVTDNTMGSGDETGLYGGTEGQNSSTVSRFFKFKVDYPVAEEEVQILAKRFPTIPETTIEQFVSFANAVRVAHKNGLRTTIGTGEVIDLVEISDYFGDAWIGTQRVLLDGLTGADYQAVKDLYDAQFRGVPQ